MRYLTFKNKVDSFPVITQNQLQIIDDPPQLIKNQLNRWQKKGLIIKLKKGMYVLCESDRKINPSKLFLANQLYFPSYVSTEYALGFYDLIPERVTDITSVTPRKTYKIKNALGIFVYQHMKPSGFIGFVSIKDENGFGVFIAQPEKAIVDFFYLNLFYFKEKYDLDIFEKSFRFQNLDRLKRNKLFLYSESFHSQKLKSVIENFCKFMRRK